MKNLYILIVLLITIPIFSQNINEVLVPYLKNGKYGYVNVEKQIIIKAKYDKALPFYQGYDLSIASRNNNPVVINRKGKTISKSSTDYFLRDTTNGMRLLTPQNIERIALRSFCQLDSCKEFAVIEAFAGRRVFDKMNEFYFVSNEGKAYLIDKNGKKKTENYDKIAHFDYGEIEYCITEDQANLKKGLLDENGTAILECVYDNIIYKGKGVFSIQQGSIERDFKVKTKLYSANIIHNESKSNYRITRKNQKSGVVNNDGKLLITYSYDKLYPLNEDKFIFWKDNQIGIIDLNENQIFVRELPFGYTGHQNIQNYVPYTVFNKNHVFFNIQNKWCLINLEGAQIGYNYNGVYIDFQNVVGGVAGVVIDNKLGVIDKNGEPILKPVYDEIYCLKEDDSFLVKTQQKWSWLDSEGQIISDDFDDFGYQLKNHVLVLKNGEWFYVGNNGSIFKDE